MNRHFWRACGSTDESGLTLVELLVTIIVAGIAFAAIVPVFVQALGAGQSDRTRALALSVAQDRIEKIRELSYEELTETNLNDPDFHFGLFGTTTTGANGTTDKAFKVAYSVQEVPVSSTDTRIAFKKVAVRVTWDGAPFPHKTVSLTTAVYRQSAGPKIIDATLDQTRLDTDTKTEIAITPIRVSYFVDEADLESMEPKTFGVAPNQHTVVGRVEISVSPGETYKIPYTSPSFAGNQLAGTVGRTGNEFYVYWSPPGAAAGTTGIGDGYYSFSARAFSSLGYVGEASTLIGSMRVETGPPPGVTDLQASGAGTTGMTNGIANIQWTASIATDLDHYDVYRINPDGSEVKIGGGAGWKATGTSDSNLTVGQVYRYRVVSVDWVGKTTSVTSEPMTVIDSMAVPPAAPTGLRADLSGTSITLTWAASVSANAAGYHVYVSDGTASTLITSVASGQPMSVSYDQGAGSTRYYTVKAFGTVSPDSAAATVATGYPTGTVGTETWARVTTPAVVDYDISAKVNSLPSQYAVLKNLELWYLGPSGTSTGVKVGSTQVTTGQAPVFTVTSTAWNAQPAGSYELRWYYVKSNGNLSAPTKKLFSCSGGTSAHTSTLVGIP